MTLIGFPFAATRLDCINRILVANSTAVIATSCIITTHGCRIISVSIVGMANGRAGIFGLVVLADGHAHIVGHAVFSNGHTVFLGIGLMPDGHSGPAFSSHIAAHGHRICGVDETGHHVVSVYKGPVRGIVSLPAISNIPLFIQPVAGIRLIAGQFSISIHIVTADGIQNLGLIADGRRMVPFGHIVHTHSSSSADVIRAAGCILTVIGGYIIVNFYGLVVIRLGTVITSFRIFCPDVILIIHILARSQFIDFHLFVIIGIGIGIIDLYRDPFRIQLLIDIGFVPTNGFLGIRGMGEFAHAVPGSHDHIFRFAIDPGIAGIWVILDRNDFIVFAHNQVALGIIGGIGT